ncbi:ABC transporter ATP-binding protein [Abyssisolibacter fermentans]|uniref:ABC transporter ATP-binding protein n=1 Tax=Abyssisolibacter fermentans TaxID=1766203 RepID=UPI00082E5F0A|nr:ATP-binding cassette domain-containing protein [Abyssisolibacter fermentans]
MENYIIETNNLTKAYKDMVAVNNVNLKIREGLIYGFLGPNGAGKSTTIGMLLGLIKPTKGSVKIFDMDIKKNRMKILRNIGSIIESPSYYGNLSAYDNLKISADILGLDYKNIGEVLGTVNLTKVKNKKVKKFSLGMKQRLGIAQALIGMPKLLLLDEPTNGLDPVGIHEIRELIKSLPKKYGMTVLISSHILSEIELIANDIGIINEGKLLFQGTLDELKNSNPNKNLEEIFFNILEYGGGNNAK